MYGSVGRHHDSAGAWHGAKAGAVSEADLHLRLRAPNMAMVIVMFGFLHFAVCGVLTFCFDQLAPWVCAVLVLVSTLWPLELRARNYPSAPWMLGMCLVAAVSGAMAGIANYHRFGANFLAAQLGREYWGVRPDAGALGYVDGGVLRFSEDAVVNAAEGVGVRFSGHTFCAAPVVLQQANATGVSQPTLQFWAIGRDCCSARGNFRCGDAGDVGAHGGLVLHSEEDMLTDSFVAPHNHYEEYMAAVRASAALYALDCASKPVLVQWAHNPERVAMGWLAHAICIWGASTVIFTFFAGIAWREIHIHHDLKIRKAVSAIKQFSASLGFTSPLASQASLAPTGGTTAGAGSAGTQQSTGGLPLWSRGAGSATGGGGWSFSGGGGVAGSGAGWNFGSGAGGAGGWGFAGAGASTAGGAAAPAAHAPQPAARKKAMQDPYLVRA